MPVSETKQIKLILDYNASRQYFGKYAPADVNAGYGAMRRSQGLDNPIFTHKIKIGTINSTVICDALWREMSYNPVRFGTQSPFKEPNAIYRFCSRPPQNIADADTRKILVQIRHHLIAYMTINGVAHNLTSGQWFDKMSVDDDGCTYMRFINGHSGPVLKMLGHLRDCIKLIARQNVADLKSELYRDQIIQRVNALHPTGVRDIMPTKNVTDQSYEDEYRAEIAQQRLDDMMDSLQITLDNRAYVPADIYAQAVCDRNRIILQSASQNTK